MDADLSSLSVDELQALIAEENAAFDVLRAEYKAKVSALNGAVNAKLAKAKLDDLARGLSDSDKAALAQLLAPKSVASAEAFGKIGG